ncbi:hypothetical protein HYC85_015239 [Camellia sinensis]|uniref:Uncharacterized protein n=1 Tax=Camellia sinensis TaxID=4442 RepID=A0A7J7GYE3_CAMSI|nr:hypothetical protein HYC85_015239 [Camellia sinensis]
MLWPWTLPWWILSGSNYCDNGWYGIDCSISSVLSVIRDWLQWLRPVQVDVPDSPQHVGNLVNLNAMVEKKRPLIYVYDFPQNSIIFYMRSVAKGIVMPVYGPEFSDWIVDGLISAFYDQKVGR